MKQFGGELAETFARLPERLFSGPQGCFHLLLIGDVDAGADVAGKGAVRPKPGYTRVEDPTIFSIEPLQAVFHAESLPCIKGFAIGVADSAANRPDGRPRSTRRRVGVPGAGR